MSSIRICLMCRHIFNDFVILRRHLQDWHRLPPAQALDFANGGGSLENLISWVPAYGGSKSVVPAPVLNSIPKVPRVPSWHQNIEPIPSYFKSPPLSPRRMIFEPASASAVTPPLTQTAQGGIPISTASSRKKTVSDVMYYQALVKIRVEGARPKVVSLDIPNFETYGYFLKRMGEIFLGFKIESSLRRCEYIFVDHDDNRGEPQPLIDWYTYRGMVIALSKPESKWLYVVIRYPLSQTLPPSVKPVSPLGAETKQARVEQRMSNSSLLNKSSLKPPVEEPPTALWDVSSGKKIKSVQTLTSRPSSPKSVSPTPQLAPLPTARLTFPDTVPFEAPKPISPSTVLSPLLLPQPTPRSLASEPPIITAFTPINQPQKPKPKLPGHAPANTRYRCKLTARATKKSDAQAPERRVSHIIQRSPCGTKARMQDYQVAWVDGTTTWEHEDGIPDDQQSLLDEYVAGLIFATTHKPEGEQNGQPHVQNQESLKQVD